MTRRAVRLSDASKSALAAALLLAALAALASCRSAGSAGAIATPPSIDATHRRMLWPALLKPGDTIMFVAPAGALDRERMARARGRLEARGYRVVERDDLYSEEGYLAGSDERRAAELMQAFLDPEVDAIFPGTGGYGTMRILDRLDYEAIRRNPKVFVGFSDITGLHAALQRRAGLVTFHSPAPMYLFGGEGEAEEFTVAWFLRAIEVASQGAGCDYAIDVPPESPQPYALGQGRARGRLVGGSLSLVAALEGTPYAVETDGAILLLEDVREAPYRVDRMLRQLELAGRLDRLAGVVLGQFTLDFDREDAPRDPDPRYTTEGVLKQYFEKRGIPVLMNFPVGHHPMNATLPLGGTVEIDADTATLTVLPSVEAPADSTARLEEGCCDPAEDQRGRHDEARRGALGEEKHAAERGEHRHGELHEAGLYGLQVRQRRVPDRVADPRGDAARDPGEREAERARVQRRHDERDRHDRERERHGAREVPRRHRERSARLAPAAQAVEPPGDSGAGHPENRERIRRRCAGQDEKHQARERDHNSEAVEHRRPVTGEQSAGHHRELHGAEQNEGADARVELEVSEREGDRVGEER